MDSTQAESAAESGVAAPGRASPTSLPAEPSLLPGIGPDVTAGAHAPAARSNVGRQRLSMCRIVDAVATKARGERANVRCALHAVNSSGERLEPLFSLPEFVNDKTN